MNKIHILDTNSNAIRIKSRGKKIKSTINAPIYWSEYTHTEHTERFFCFINIKTKSQHLNGIAYIFFCWNSNTNYKLYTKKEHETKMSTLDSPTTRSDSFHFSAFNHSFSLVSRCISNDSMQKKNIQNKVVCSRVLWLFKMVQTNVSELKYLWLLTIYFFRFNLFLISILFSMIGFVFFSIHLFFQIGPQKRKKELKMKWLNSISIIDVYLYSAYSIHSENCFFFLNILIFVIKKYSISLSL